MSYEYVTREEWGARPARWNPAIRVVRRRYLKVHWTVGCVERGAHRNCADTVRGIQRFHMDVRGWSDIAYGEVVCPHGYVFEGRGPARRSAANGTATLNYRHEAIACISAPACPVTEKQLDALGARLRDRRALEVLNHSDGYATACPGPLLTRWVREHGWIDPNEYLTELGPAYWAWKGWTCSSGPWRNIGKAELGAKYRPKIPRRGDPRWATWYARFRASGGCS